MGNEIVTSQGYDRDIAAINDGKLVLLHRWAGGHILLMSFDPHMPDWTTKPVERLSPEQVEEKIREMEGACFGPARAEKYATGYVFRVYEENPSGHMILEGSKYAELEIYDYVLWTDEQQVKRKYHEVVAKARLEE